MSLLLQKIRNHFGFGKGSKAHVSKTVQMGYLKPDLKVRVYSVISIGIIGLAWILISEMNLVQALFCPSPGAVFKRLIEIGTEGYRGHTIFGHIAVSCYRILFGFLLGCLVGIPLGFAMGTSKMIQGVFDPIIEFLRPVPPLAFIPLVITWMGIGDSPKIALLFLSTSAIMVVSSRAGASNVNLEKIQVAYTLGASRWQVLRYVIFPSSLANVFTGMHLAMGVAWGTLVAAEMVAATGGIGWMILSASRFLQTDIIVLGIIAIGATGYAFELVIRTVEKSLVPWKGRG